VDKEDPLETGRLAGIQKELDEKRAEWRAVRTERMALKARLEGDGLGRAAIRKDRRYRELEKRQDRLATLIKHIEKRLNRARAILAKTGAAIEGLILALALSDPFPF
jgi:predicted  nucleic acid-binding Zn-ribbon protein